MTPSRATTFLPLEKIFNYELYDDEPTMKLIIRYMEKNLQFVEIELDPNETAIAESGAMMMMEDGIQMQTIFGDGSAQQRTGFLGKLMSAGKRGLDR